MTELLSRCDEQNGLVVAGIDLDGFKGINDGYGHAVGDLLLKAVAARLMEMMRGDDRVFRVGGDEFAVVLSGLPIDTMADEGMRWATRLIEHLSAPYEILTHSLELGASIGFALCPEDGREAEELARRADLALYVAKENGKGRVERFEVAMDVEARERVELEEQLRHALDMGQLSLHYQPQYHSESGALSGFEALMRWHHPTLGDVAPGVFIPLAERMRLMDGIGAFALRTACRFAAGWARDEGRDGLLIAVNVSPSQLENARFVENVIATLEDSGLPPERLELEVTEEALIDRLDHVRRALQQLRDIGVSIAVDDFGRGQTSLRYLNELPVSRLKIDRSFVGVLEQDARARQITESIVTLSHRLGCGVIAEGVERPGQAALLRDLNCDQMQGYMFARPMKPAEVEAMLANSKAA